MAASKRDPPPRPWLSSVGVIEGRIVGQNDSGRWSAWSPCARAEGRRKAGEWPRRPRVAGEPGPPNAPAAGRNALRPVARAFLPDRFPPIRRSARHGRPTRPFRRATLCLRVSVVHLSGTDHHRGTEAQRRPERIHRGWTRIHADGDRQRGRLEQKGAKGAKRGPPAQADLTRSVRSTLPRPRQSSPHAPREALGAAVCRNLRQERTAGSSWASPHGLRSRWSFRYCSRAHAASPELKRTSASSRWRSCLRSQ
jgi:hypothetical protein